MNMKEIANANAKKAKIFQINYHQQAYKNVRIQTFAIEFPRKREQKPSTSRTLV